jgi:hypothetical protein
MAQLKSGSTVGGNSILTTASSVGFPSGTVMVFYQASAPTGWTKSTTNNDKTLRVVSGSGGGTGGTHALTSPPSTSHTHTGASHTHSTPAHSHSHSLSAGAHTLTIAEMPSHNHSAAATTGAYANAGGPTAVYATNSSTGSTGGGGSHSHSLSGSITSGGSGTSGSGGTGATSSNGSTAFAPQYIDVIVCSKN